MSELVEDVEKWRPIGGQEGFYEVSSLGRVRSIDRKIHRSDGRSQRRQGRLLKACRAPAAKYLSVTLRFGERKAVHGLVCEAFLGPRPSADHEAAHWNGDPTDNRLSNLRWATRAENQADSARHGTKYAHSDQRGEQNFHSRLTWADVGEIRRRWISGESQRSIARAFGIGKSQVSNIVRGAAWAS